MKPHSCGVCTQQVRHTSLQVASPISSVFSSAKSTSPKCVDPVARFLRVSSPISSSTNCSCLLCEVTKERLNEYISELTFVSVKPPHSSYRPILMPTKRLTESANGCTKWSSTAVIVCIFLLLWFAHHIELFQVKNYEIVIDNRWYTTLNMILQRFILYVDRFVCG